MAELSGLASAGADAQGYDVMIVMDVSIHRERERRRRGQT
jgi:hypothetical protein